LWRKDLEELATLAGFTVGADEERGIRNAFCGAVEKDGQYPATIDRFDLPMRPTLVVSYPPTEIFLGWREPHPFPEIASDASSVIFGF
jgi:hypothetical protein